MTNIASCPGVSHTLPGLADDLLGKYTDLPSAPREVRNRRLYTARKVVPDTRIAHCLWMVAHNREVEVVLSADNHAGYAGVVRCGLRSCPNCAAVEALHDFHRAHRVIESWVDDGCLPLMVAYTMRHHSDEALADLRKAFVEAQELLHKARSWRRLAEDHGIGADRFYGNEVTDGSNGWHLHRHYVYKVSRDGLHDYASRVRYEAYLKRELTRLWLKALEKRGRAVEWDAYELEHAVKVQLGAGTQENVEAAARYATKFALESTYSVSKKGRRGGRSPWELLDDAADSRLTAAQRARARARFREFVASTRGMHWTWFSEGCAVGPNEDEKPWSDDPGVAVFKIIPFEWHCLCVTNRQAWLLTLVETIGYVEAQAELRRFCDSQRWSKRFRWADSESPGGQLMDAAAF